MARRRGSGWAIFTGDVLAKDKYRVDSPPGITFKTRAEAKRHPQYRKGDKIMRY